MNFNGINRNNFIPTDLNANAPYQKIPIIIPPNLNLAVQSPLVFPQPVSTNIVFKGQNKDLSFLSNSNDVNVLSANAAVAEACQKFEIEASPIEGTSLLNILNAYFFNRIDKQLYLPVLMNHNIFQILLNHPQGINYLPTIPFENFIQISLMQNSDFVLTDSLSSPIYQLIRRELSKGLNQNINISFLISNLPLFILGFNRGFLYYKTNPLNLFKSTPENPFNEDETKLFMELLFREYSIGNCYSPPFKEINPLFESTDFAEGYEASVEFYLLFFGLTYLWDDSTPQKGIRIQSLFRKDSLGFSFNSYLNTTPDLRAIVLEKMKVNYLSDNRNHNESQFNFYVEFADALDDFENGGTDKMHKALEHLRDLGQIQLYCKESNKQFLLEKIVSSPDTRLQEIIRSSPLSLFNTLYPNFGSLKVDSYSTQKADRSSPQLSLSPIQLLNLLPFGRVSNIRKQDLIFFLHTNVLKNLMPLTEKFAKSKSELDESTLEKLTALHNDLTSINPLENLEKNSSDSTNGLYSAYLTFFPGLLYDVKTFAKGGVNSIVKNTPLYEERQRNLRTNPQEYRVTLVHYLCNRSKYNTIMAPPTLMLILRAHPDALFWPDSNGRTVLDIAEDHPELKQWLFERGLLRNKDGTQPKAVPQILYRPNQPPAGTFFDYLKNLSDAVLHLKSARIRFIQKMKDHLNYYTNLKGNSLINLREHQPGDLLFPNGLVKLPHAFDLNQKLVRSDASEVLLADLFLKLIFNQFEAINQTISDKKIATPPVFDPNSSHFDFLQDRLSDRQRREIVGTVCQLKRSEFHQFASQKEYDLFFDLVMDHTKLSEMNVIPLLVIREEGDQFHAEIVQGHFTPGGHIIAVSPDRSGAMSHKVSEIVGNEAVISGPDEEDRTAKITLEGMKLLTDYCKNEKGLNILILPRLDISTLNTPEQPKFPKVCRKPQQSQERRDKDDVLKRNIDATMPIPKRKKVESVSIEPQPLPDTGPTAEAEKRYLQSIGGITSGKHALDFDEMSEAKRVKSDSKSPPDRALIPGSAAARQGHEQLMVDSGDPAAYVKNLAFMWIHKTLENVTNSLETSKVLQEGVTLPIEDKLLDLPRMENHFVFSSLYPYQYADLKRVIQLQKAGIFPLISYRMGLGKTYLYIELIMQQLAVNAKGIHMVVVPKSVLPQAASDMKKALLNAKATAWRSLLEQNLSLAISTLKSVLHPPATQRLDESALLSLLPSIHLIKDEWLVTSFHKKISSLSDTQRSQECVIAPNLMKARPDQLEGFANLIQFRSDSIVVVDSKPKRSPFVPGRIIITKYHQVAHFECDQLDSLTIDEAQKINKKSKKLKQNQISLHESLQNFIRSQKNPKFTPNIITATPLENSPLELWTLLQLVNPSLFTAESFNALEKHVKLIDKQVVNIRKTRNFPLKEALKVFVEYYRLKMILQKTVVYLTQKEASSLYGTKFPTAKKIDLLVNLGDDTKKIDEMTRRFAKKDGSNYFNFLSEINLVLTHPNFFGKKIEEISVELESLKKTIASGKQDEVIKKSSLLGTLFQSEAFHTIFEKRKKGLLIIDNIAPGELIRLAANKNSVEKESAEYTRFYNGKLSERQRDELVQWFKTGDGEPRLLILSIEAGGVGLNLPEADLVIVASKSYNPWQVKQAIDRAFRSGHEGEKPVYQLTYEDSFFSTHLSTIRTIKKLWVKMLFRPQPSLKQELAIWMQTRFAEAKKLALNNDKDMTDFNRNMEKLERKLNRIVDRVDEVELLEMVQAALPPYPVTMTLAVADYHRIPIPYGFSKEEVELFTYAYVVDEDDQALNQFKKIAFDSWAVRQATMNSDCFRYPENHGLIRYRGHIQNVIKRMKELELLIPPSYAFTLIEGQQYECQSWNPNNKVDSSLILYCRPGNHYEALVNKKK